MAVKVLEVNVDDIGYGGVFSFVKNILRYKADGLKIDIASLEKFENEKNIRKLEEYGSNVFFVGYVGNKVLKQFHIMCNLRKLLKTERYNCVHIHADVANKLLVSGLTAKWMGVNKIILHSHASGVDGNHRLFKRAVHECCRYLLKYIGTDFVACSDKAAGWMYPNIPKSNIKIIKNGIELNKFKYDDEKRKYMRNKLNVADSFVVGHVGRFAYQKNHEFLIKVFAEVKKNCSNAKLLLIGEGVLEKNILKQVFSLGLDSDVLFYGVSDEVYNLYQAMDVFVLPSWFEGLPIAGVEAQAAGLPVVFSDYITASANITGMVSYLPITDESVQEWAHKILTYQNEKRVDVSSKLTEEGFSIQDVTNFLEEIYKRETK